MKTIFESQAEFLSAGEVKFPTTAAEDLLLPATLIQEEFEEFLLEPDYLSGNNLNDLKECIDLIYVAAQYLNQAVGPVKAQKLFDAVHANNMDKCTDGKLVKNNLGKIMKPVDFDKNAWQAHFKETLNHE